jgi:hypothetical protein
MGKVRDNHHPASVPVAILVRKPGAIRADISKAL